MARPCFQPTDEQRKIVEAMAEVGVPQDAIAKVIGCSKPTLEKYFREELDLGEAKASAKIAEKLFNMAMEGNVACTIFWLKCRAGWNENTIRENRKIDSTSINKISVDPIEASREYLRIVSGTDTSI